MKQRARLDPLVFYVEIGDPQRIAMANLLADAMNYVGIPGRPQLEPPYLIFQKIMEERDYHIYVGSQVVYRYPIW